MVKYTYDAYGNVFISGTLSSTIGELNPYRYRGYYYDVETSLFWLSSRYYSPELCRFISPDDIEYLDPESVNGLNLYCYCKNDSISYYDPSGHAPKWLRDVLDIGLYVVSAVVAVVAGIVVSKVTTPKVGKASGIAIFGSLNNITNAIYYNYISDGENDVEVTSSSYTEDGYINRWDRLDYVKSQEGMPSNYNKTARMYFSEYNLHMYGWFLTGWAHEKNIPILSDIADSCKNALVIVGEKDGRIKVDLPAAILRWLGL